MAGGAPYGCKGLSLVPGRASVSLPTCPPRDGELPPESGAAMRGSIVEAGSLHVLREPFGLDIWHTDLQGAAMAADEQVAAERQSRARWRRRCGPCRRGTSALVRRGVTGPEAGESGQAGSSQQKKLRRAGGMKPRLLHPRFCLAAEFCSIGN
jgi:hypothetical protein